MESTRHQHKGLKEIVNKLSKVNDKHFQNAEIFRDSDGLHMVLTTDEPEKKKRVESIQVKKASKKSAKKPVRKKK